MESIRKFASENAVLAVAVAVVLVLLIPWLRRSLSKKAREKYLAAPASPTLAIARKELAVYLTTPWAWIVFTVMAFVSAASFVFFLIRFQEVQTIARQVGWQRIGPGAEEFRNLTDGVVVNQWGFLLIVLLFLVPILAMGLFAKEHETRTMELLMTAPVRSAHIVLGKYLGGVGIALCTIASTLVYPIVLALYGNSESGSALEWSTVLLGYGALLLWSATWIAIGMFVSSLTESQLLAVVVTIVVGLLWLLLDGFAGSAEEPMRSVLKYLSFGAQLQNPLKGVLDLKPLVFFGSIITLCLLLTHRSVESQRWS